MNWPRVKSRQVLCRMVAARTTLASIRILDANGRVLVGRDDAGASYADLPEVRLALAGKTATVLRHRGDYAPRYWLEFLSRASDMRVQTRCVSSSR